MSVEIPTGYAQVAWEFRYPGDPDPWYCTLGVQVNGGTPTATDVANFLFDCWGDTVLQQQSTSLTMSSCIVKMGNDGPPIMGYSTAAARLGNISQPYLPQNCACLVDKLSDSGGRRGRGRFYVPACLPEGNVNDIGVIETSKVTALQAEFDALQTSLVPGLVFDCDPVLLHSPSAPEVVTPTPTGLPTPITGFRVQQIISTQRKRLR